MDFQLPLLAVKDVDVSKKFYRELFGQTVALDLGKNVTFSGGFAIQEEFAQLTNVPPDSVIWNSHSMELYFETEDFDGFLKKLERHGGIDYVHPVKTYEWQQRVARIYDPDCHMIEIGESMAFLARKFVSEGRTPEETAELIQHPIDFVYQSLKEKPEH